MLCVICRTEFFPETDRADATNCDCGANLSRTDANLTDPREVRRARTAYRNEVPAKRRTKELAR